MSDPLTDRDDRAARLAEWNDNQARLIKRIAAKYNATSAVLREREQELLDIKGPCSNKRCSLHYAHSGPCDTEDADYAY